MSINYILRELQQLWCHVKTSVISAGSKVTHAASTVILLTFVIEGIIKFQLEFIEKDVIYCFNRRLPKISPRPFVSIIGILDFLSPIFLTFLLILSNSWFYSVL